jgi:hypothetical protein
MVFLGFTVQDVVEAVPQDLFSWRTDAVRRFPGIGVNHPAGRTDGAGDREEKE